MPGYTDRFGGSTLQAAQVAYRAVALTASIVLAWPIYATEDNEFARLTDLSATGNGFTVTLPDATLVTPGQDGFFNNRGLYDVELLDSAGGSIATVPAGGVRYLYLTDNSTAAGLWTSVLFGTVSSTLDASQLAGYGLKAINNTLAQASVTSLINGNTTVASTDRTKVYIWTGGTGTLALPTLATATNDFYIEVRNQGTGVLTVQPADGLVDGSATADVQLNESFFLHAGPAAWYTVGRGRSTQFVFTQLLKGVTGGTDTLSLSEAANVVQTFTGVLTSNEVVVEPAVVQVYYVSNQTSGAFSLTFRCPGTGTTVSIPTGQNAVLFSDGVNIINASTTVAGISSLVMAAGTVSSPSLAISTTNTGLYSPGSNQVGVTANGVQVAQFDSTGMKSTGSGTVETKAVSTAGASGLVTDRPAGQNGHALWRTLGVNRWSLTADTTAESGSNAGSNIKLVAYDDAGASLGNAFSINRASRVVDFAVAPTVAGGSLVFPAGTAVLFQQTAAPTGWTKQTTHNDKSLRVVSGAASSGGATAFTSVFGAGKTAGGTALSVAELPSHTHTGTTGNVSNDHSHGFSGTTGAMNSNQAHSHTTPAAGPGGETTILAAGTSPLIQNTPTSTVNIDHTHNFSGNTGGISANHTHSFTSNATGSGSAHNHTLSLDLQYVDVIIATKD